MNINAVGLRKMYLNFFKSKGHTVIPSASIIPENDSSVLFIMAGMHPLVPYLLGKEHPAGKRLVGVQKCVRTIDIDEVGDTSHLTFFEMLGNWSLGDYFRDESIAWSFEFLTSKDYLDIPFDRLAFSVYEGDENVPRDDESVKLWMECGVSKDKIFYLAKEHNWWGQPTGGPCGPDSEIFYITDTPACGPDCNPSCDCGHYLEIWNNVFMQYNLTKDGKYEDLPNPNIDTGMGLDRTIAVLQGVSSVYETDLFLPIIAKIEELSGKKYGESTDVTKAMRVIADHIRSATFMIGDEKSVAPSNMDQGYILRRLIRRAVRFGRKLNMPRGFTADISQVVCELMGEHYTELADKAVSIGRELRKEEKRFAKTLDRGLKEFNKLASALNDGDTIGGKNAFRLYDTFGFPIELTVEMAVESNLSVDEIGFDAAFKEHQKKSSAGGEQKFKGGMADSSKETTNLHTATHLLHAALRAQLGEEVSQRGSNITPERLRFDFNFPRKVERPELDKLEEWVNNAIAKNTAITMEEMTVDGAKSAGAIGLFTSKYGDKVNVYTMGEFSKEICGGPHAKSTGELGKFKIKKEQAISAGVRRIRAELSSGE